MAVIYLVSQECGHSHLASKEIRDALPEAGQEIFAISFPRIGKRLQIFSRRGECLTSEVREIRYSDLFGGTSKYLRITTQNSILSLIMYRQATIKE